MTNLRTVGYWSSTIVLALVLLSGGIADLARNPATAQGVLDLGYPPLFLTILGTWKVLGAAALLAPRSPRLKEWAYAGSFFNFSGAVLSHLVAGSAAFHITITGLFTIVTIASWWLRPKDRTLAAPGPTHSAPPAPHPVLTT
jgi:DoxX-like family